MNPAKITDRFLAYLIDTFPFGLGYYASLYWLMSRGYLPVAPGSQAGMLGVWIALYVGYHSAFNAWGGGTIGKRLLELRVVDERGEGLGFGRNFIRALGLLASTPLFNLGFLWAFVNRDSRTWHDLLAGSWVVETRPKSAGELRLNALASFALLFGILALSFRFQLMRPAPEDVAAIQKARAGLEVLARVEEKYKSERGTYTDKLIDLAVAAGGRPEEFAASMREIFDSNGLRISADKNRFRLDARARDRRKTVVSVSGP